jgi:hypothetical protein
MAPHPHPRSEPWLLRRRWRRRSLQNVLWGPVDPPRERTSGANIPAVQRLGAKLFGRVLEVADWRALLGAPSQAFVLVFRGGDALSAHVRVPGVGHTDHSFAAGNEGCQAELRSLAVSPSRARQGIGRQWFSQVAHGHHAFNLPQLRVWVPAQGPLRDFFPKVGCDGPLPPGTQALVEGQPPQARTVQELLTLHPRGPHLWRNQLEACALSFDLRQDSPSWERLRAQLKAFGGLPSPPATR